jgi:ATP-dependent Clp protease adapter protein ClpS
MEHVVAVLVRVLGCPVEQAIQMMAKAHNTGQAIIFTGSLGQAELVKDKVLGHAPDQNSPADCSPTRLIATQKKAPD